MIYLKSLRLQNFQTHLDTTFELSPNFNCIIGSTRSGKSSCVRALDFLFYNEWIESYQRFDTPRAIITAVLSNGATIIRTKSKTENKLVIQTPSGKKEFEGFGTKLPREFIELCSVFPIDVDSETAIRANVSNQDDPLFLLYAPPEAKSAASSIRTKILSRLSGLHWIDYALKDLNKDRRNNSTELQRHKDSILELKESAKNCAIIEKEMTSLIDAARAKFNSIKEKGDFIQRLETLVAKTSKWKSEFQQLQQIKSSLADIPRLERVLNIYETCIKRTLDLRSKYTIYEVSCRNIAIHLQNTRDAAESINNLLKEELIKNPYCITCGSKMEYKTFVERGC